MMMFWLASLALGAPCASPTSLDGVEALATDMFLALETTNVEAFEPARDRLFLALPCVNEPLTPSLAAQVHLAVGVAQFTAGDPDAARAGIDAAYHLDPSVWRRGLAPDGHPLQQMWAEAETSSLEPTPVSPPRFGRLLFDGTESKRRPSLVATVVQHEVDGTIAFTAWVPPGTALPRYETRRTLSPQLTSTLRIGGATLTAAGVGMYGLALSNKFNFQDADPTGSRDDFDTQLRAMQRRGNTLVVASAASVALGVGVLSASWAF